MDIETALAELGHYITHHLDVSYQNAWDEVLAERQQLQQDLDAAKGTAASATYTIGSLREQLRAKEEENRKLLGLLKDLEWVGFRDGVPDGPVVFCPLCEGSRYGFNPGHTETCELRQALEETVDAN